ncbi:MAG: NAD(P)-dependent oxidoreductase [Herpetosiphonaceae bacterium]|nr:NAD(P)-dependent oxidoreductase [Herpetosiphonaceae bacterium]
MDDRAAIQCVGFVGVGRMGGPMAFNLHRAGFVVQAFDVASAPLQHLAQAGVPTADSLQTAVTNAGAIILMLPSDDALRQTMEGSEGLLSCLQPGQLVIDMSTSTLASSRHFATLVAERGATMLDAPVSGGEAGAQAGTLSIMVGGDTTALERCRPLFEALGRTITHIGGNGLGLVAKYVNQMLMEATFCAVAESFALAAKAGADLAAIYQAVGNGLGGSRVLDSMIPQLLSGDLGHGRELALHYKDGGYALAAGEFLGAWVPVTQLTHDLFAAAVAAGQETHSAVAVARVYEQRTGVQIVSQPATGTGK